MREKKENIEMYKSCVFTLRVGPLYKYLTSQRKEFGLKIANLYHLKQIL